MACDKAVNMKSTEVAVMDKSVGDQITEDIPFRVGFSFLELPLEIRSMIYHYYLFHHNTIVVDPDCRRYLIPGQHLDLALIFVNKRVYAEGTSVLYGLNTFLMHSGEPRPLAFHPQVPRSISRIHFEQIRHLHLKIFFGTNDVSKINQDDGSVSEDIVHLRRFQVEHIAHQLSRCLNLQTLFLHLISWWDEDDFPSTDWENMAPGDAEDTIGKAFPDDGWRKALWPLLIALGVRNFGVSINYNNTYESADVAIGLENWLGEAIKTPRTTEGAPTDTAVDDEEYAEKVGRGEAAEKATGEYDEEVGDD